MLNCLQCTKQNNSKSMTSKKAFLSGRKHNDSHGPHSQISKIILSNLCPFNRNFFLFYAKSSKTSDYVMSINISSEKHSTFPRPEKTWLKTQSLEYKKTSKINLYASFLKIYAIFERIKVSNVMLFIFVCHLGGLYEGGL